MPAPRLSERSLSPESNRAGSSHWLRNLRLIALLLLAWALLTLLPPYFAEQLSFPVFGWPFSYWMAAYGSPAAYLLIIVVYAAVMNRNDPEDAEK
jgi:putative solute:sodium symporter small subunit